MLDVTYRIWEPAVGDERSLLLHTHHFAHVFEAGVVGYQVIEWRLIVLYDPCNKPESELFSTKVYAAEPNWSTGGRAWSDLTSPLSLNRAMPDMKHPLKHQQPVTHSTPEYFTWLHPDLTQPCPLLAWPLQDFGSGFNSYIISLLIVMTFYRLKHNHNTSIRSHYTSV